MRQSFLKNLTLCKLYRNPSFEEISSYSPSKTFHYDNNLNNKPILALLPGSRKQELDYMLNLMVKVSKDLKSHQIVIGAVKTLPKTYYEPYIKQGVKVVFDQSFDLLSYADKALVTSGTASLETCLFKVPQIVCYKTSVLTAEIVRKLIKVKYASLVNLIADKLVVTELLQENFTKEKLEQELQKLLSDTKYVDTINQGYKEVFDKIGSPGASKKCAKMFDLLQK